MNGKDNMWIDYKNYKHFDLLEQLRDIALSEYDVNLNPHLVAESIKQRYNQLPWPPKVDWHLHPLIMNKEINKDYSTYWPASTEFASKIPEDKITQGEIICMLRIGEDLTIGSYMLQRINRYSDFSSFRKRVIQDNLDIFESQFSQLFRHNNCRFFGIFR